MSLNSFIRAMPKVELHVHVEGSIRPETLLKLARRNQVELPADTVEGLRQWYTFTDFPHFVEIYIALTNCIRTPEDLELIFREFLEGQAAQNIRHTEATYTAFTVFELSGIPFEVQMQAINRAREWAKQALGVTLALIVDIAREVEPAVGMVTAEWVKEWRGRGVEALGLGGYEVGYPPERHTEALKLAQAAGVPCILHAGETEGPASIWGALKAGKSIRIGHGVRCLEDEALVAELRARQIPLEVCPTSNVCLKVVPTLAQHPLPRLLNAGLYVTINSDDPPMFNTTLTDEYVRVAETFGFGAAELEQFVLNALRASLLSEAERAALEAEFVAEFTRLREEHLA